LLLLVHGLTTAFERAVARLGDDHLSSAFRADVHLSKLVRHGRSPTDLEISVFACRETRLFPRRGRVSSRAARRGRARNGHRRQEQGPTSGVLLPSRSGAIVDRARAAPRQARAPRDRRAPPAASPVPTLPRSYPRSTRREAEFAAFARPRSGGANAACRRSPAEPRPRPGA